MEELPDIGLEGRAADRCGVKETTVEFFIVEAVSRVARLRENMVQIAHVFGLYDIPILIAAVQAERDTAPVAISIRVQGRSVTIYNKFDVFHEREPFI